MPKWRSLKRGFLFGVPQPAKGLVPPKQAILWHSKGQNAMEQSSGSKLKLKCWWLEAQAKAAGSASSIA